MASSKLGGDAVVAILTLCLFTLSSVNGQACSRASNCYSSLSCSSPLVASCGINPASPEEGMQCLCAERCTMGLNGAGCSSASQLLCAGANLPAECGDSEGLRANTGHCTCRKCSSTLNCPASLCDGNSEAFCKTDGFCGCRTKTCALNSQCTGVCPADQKPWCQALKCQCVPKCAAAGWVCTDNSVCCSGHCLKYGQSTGNCAIPEYQGCKVSPSPCTQQSDCCSGICDKIPVVSIVTNTCVGNSL